MNPDIPDRVSIEDGSNFYDRRYKHLGVRFNGREVTGVVEFCVSEGWMRQQLRDKRRRFRVERGRFVTLTYRGTVEPYWRSEPGDQL